MTESPNGNELLAEPTVAARGSAAVVRNVSGSTACALAICLLPVLTAAAAGGTACFDDIEQSYEWDDGGLHWTAMPDRCPGSPLPASPSDRKWGGSVQIRVSDQDASVIEESYSWSPKRNSDSGGCPRFFKTVTRRTRVAKGGVLYETRQVDDGQTQRSQRTLEPHEVIYIANIQSVPKPGDPFVQVLGNDTIAGQPCQRIASKPIVAGAGTYEMCVFVAPVNCPTARYLQPLELTTKGPDGKTVWHGRTTSLRYGGHGQVVPPDSIRAP